MTKQMGFYFDASACTGCKTCALACKDKNNNPLGVNFRRVFDYTGGGWSQDPDHPDLRIPNNIFSYSVSVACMHCEEAPCVAVCPTTAMHKRADGIVLVDPDKCIGCRYCQWACPYGAPQYNGELGIMTKCNFCEDLLAQGQNPACVDACPMRALKYGELEELRGEYGNLNAIEPLPNGDFTYPSLIISPHKHAQSIGQGTGRIESSVGDLK